jgi:hypothetical protein
VAQPGLWPSTITPAPIRLSKELHLQWRIPLHRDAAARLCPNGERLVLADGKGSGWVIDPQAPSAGFEGWRRIDLPPGSFRPAFSSDPVYAAADGNVSRWMPDLSLRSVWRTELEDPDLEANGLPGDRLLLMAPKKWFFNRRMVDCAMGRTGWKARADWLGVFALDDVIVCASRTEGIVLAIEPESGRERWRLKTAARPSPSILGIAGEILWISDDEGRISGLDLANGEMRHAIETAGKVPRGLFDAKAEFHAISGLAYQRLDLGERPRVLMTLPGPSGWPLLADQDGRMIFRNRKGALCVFDPGLSEGAENPRTLWQGESAVRDVKASGGLLYALDDEFFLCFGPARGGA